MVGIEGRIVGHAAGWSPEPGPATNMGGGALDRLMAGGSALARFQGEGTRHTVAPGETLSEIAGRYGTDVATLARINGLADPDRLLVGQQLQLPHGATHAHVVRPGETVSGIARANGVSVAAIATANGLADADLIHPGQKLVIGGAPGDTARTDARPGRPEAATAARPAIAAAASSGAVTPDASSIKAADIAATRAEGRSSEGRCYAWVKTALQKAGAVADYLPGVAAKNAGPALEQRGFVNLLDQPGHGITSPYDAPKGAVLVYGAAPGATDRNARYGHIEIRTDKGFASDYASARARTGAAADGMEGRNRVLIGVYVKPDAATQAAAPDRAHAAGGTEAPGGAGAGLDANHRRLAQILGMGEGNYESYNTGTRGVAGGRVGHSYLNPPAGTVTNQTINEVLGTADLPGTDTHRMFAVGAYQIIQPTLRSAMTTMNLTGNERLTPELQDRIFAEFLVPTAGNGALGRFMTTGEGTVDQAQAAAARQWASIAVPAGMRTQTGAVSDGTMTYYGGPANRANVEATEALRTFLRDIQR